MVEKVNAHFEGSRKEFWSVGEQKVSTKTSPSKAGVSVSSTQDKLEVLWKHYEEFRGRNYVRSSVNFRTFYYNDRPYLRVLGR